MANERPAESRWLYNQPTNGVVENWYRRNEERIRAGWIDPKILDGAFILASTAEEMDGTSNFRYSKDQIVTTKTGPEKPARGSELWDRWQAYEDKMKESGERDGQKFSVHSFTPFLTDRELRIEMSDYSWFRMQSLNNEVGRGLPESLRDGILPTRRKEGYIFEGDSPNNACIQGILITRDNHIILTTRALQADYYQGTVSPSFEEQMDRAKDADPIATFLRAVSYSPKLKLRGEELRLTVQEDKVRLISIVQEPAFNAVGFVVIGQCEEEAAEIDETRLGVDRAEFDPSKPIWTLPLKDPTQLINDCFDLRYRWHGVGRHRAFEAVASVLGYDEAADRFYRTYQLSYI